MTRPGIKRRELLRGGTLVLLLGAQQIARGATIVAVRVWPAPEYSRVTIESDGQLSSKQIVMTNPPRLAVDIEGHRLEPELRNWSPRSSLTIPSSPASASASSRRARCGWWWT